MNDIVIFEATYNVNDSVNLTDVRQELVAESFALRGVALLMQSIKKVQSRINPSLEVYGVLVTMFTKTLHCEEVMQRIYEAFQEKVFHTVISRSIKLPDSTVAAAPITFYSPGHKTSKEYLWEQMTRPQADYSRFIRLDIVGARNVSSVVSEHAEMLRILREKDLDAIEPLMRTHLYGGVSRMGSKIYSDEYRGYFKLPENKK